MSLVQDYVPRGNAVLVFQAPDDLSLFPSAAKWVQELAAGVAAHSWMILVKSLKADLDIASFETTDFLALSDVAVQVYRLLREGKQKEAGNQVSGWTLLPDAVEAYQAGIQSLLGKSGDWNAAKKALVKSREQFKACFLPGETGGVAILDGLDDLTDLANTCVLLAREDWRGAPEEDLRTWDRVMRKKWDEAFVRHEQVEDLGSLFKQVGLRVQARTNSIKLYHSPKVKSRWEQVWRCITLARLRELNRALNLYDYSVSGSPHKRDGTCDDGYRCWRRLFYGYEKCIADSRKRSRGEN